MLLQCFFGGIRMRRLHRSDGRINIAVALDHVGAQKCLSVVFHFLLHGFVGLAEFEHHVGSSRVGARRHGGDIRGLQQEEPG